MVTRCDPAKDIIIIPGAFGHELNPVVKDNLAAKMGFDCTYPVPKPESFRTSISASMISGNFLESGTCLGKPSASAAQYLRIV